jgi:2-dehydropantoate 2-reductase
MAKEIKTIAILGPGAIGGFLAAVLVRAGHRVICIARKPSEPGEDLQLVSERFGNFSVRPRVVTRLDVVPDILFVTVKASHLLEALEAIPADTVRSTITIPLLNGCGHAEVVRGRFGHTVSVGTIGAIEARSEKPWRVELMSSNTPHVELASDGDITRERLEGVARVLTDAGLSATVLDREADVIWRKLVRLSAIALGTALAQQPVGVLRTDPAWRAKLEDIVREGAAVAAAEGVATDPEEIMRQIDALPALLTTSLQRDIAEGLPSELDAIAGAVLQRARRHGIPCPTIAAAYAELA